MYQKTVLIDFDGVIHSYISGWKGYNIACDPPVEGIKEAIQGIREAGFKVVVYSTRCKEEDGKETIRNYLKTHDIVVDDISADKLPAVVLIDDRAICFTGNTKNLVSQVVNFKSYI